MIFDLGFARQAYARSLPGIVFCSSIYAAVSITSGNEAMFWYHVVPSLIRRTTIRPIGEKDALRLILGAIALLAAFLTSAKFLLGLSLFRSAVFFASLCFSASHGPASELRFPMLLGQTLVPPRPSPAQT